MVRKTYEITMSFGQEVCTDIQYCAFIRTPVSKTCSFTLIRASISQLSCVDLNNYISKNIFPQINLKIHMIDETIKGTKDETRISLLYDRTLICLDIKTDDTLGYDTQNVFAELVLVHPILYQMETTNTFNEILTNVTGLEALAVFEANIKHTFGDTFDFRKVGSKINLNDFKYEQILVKAVNDLNVPNYLIHTYKINNNYCPYFFDDFYIADDAKNQITCHYINFFDPTVFIQLDVDDYIDTSVLTTSLEHKIFNDKNQSLDKFYPTLISTAPNMTIDSNQKFNSKIIQAEKGSIEKTKLMEGREIKTMVGSTSKIVDTDYPTTFSNLYAPDSYENAFARLDITSEFIKQKINYLYFYEVGDCTPDFPQFGRIYNLDPATVSEFTFTPLNICNIFKRNSAKNSFMEHFARCVMIKYGQI